MLRKNIAIIDRIKARCADEPEFLEWLDQAQFNCNILADIKKNIPMSVYFKRYSEETGRFTIFWASDYMSNHFKRPVEGTTDFYHFTDSKHAITAHTIELEIYKTGVPVLNILEEETWNDPDRPSTYVLTSKFPWYENGAIVGIFGFSFNISKQMDQMHEMRHRVKNDFAMLASLVHLQISESEKSEVVEALKDLSMRIEAMGQLFNLMTLDAHTIEVNMRTYISNIVHMLYQTFADMSVVNIPLVDVDNIMLSSKKALPIGLILNEAVTNAFKHAFKGRENGQVKISLKQQTPGLLCLEVIDDGVGDITESNYSRESSLGIGLIKLLSQELEGNCLIHAAEPQGTEVALVFPK